MSCFTCLTSCAGYEAPPKATLLGYWADRYRETEESAETMLEEVTDAYDATFATETVVGRPARTILDYAEQEDIDAVVVGSHGRETISRILLGSVAETVSVARPCR